MGRVNTAILILILLFRAVQLQAQWDIPFSQFWTASGYFNPSFAGESGKIQVTALYLHHLAKIEDPPRHLMLSADMPVEFWGARHGIGLQTVSTIIGGKQQRRLFAAQYALNRRAGKGILGVGLQMGALEMEGRSVDLNAGFSWRSGKIRFGGAVMHLNRPSLLPPDSELGVDSIHAKIPVSYNFMAEYNISLFHPLFEIRPAVLLLTDNASTRLHSAVRMVFDQKISAGVSRNGREEYALFAGTIIGHLQLGYAYRLYRYGPKKESGGSHEVSCRYLLPANLFKREPMPYKSIRLL